ncbi:MAG: undecaprenyl/decaprenyl-phosphate alpha-N-acetylglucosaminyl 1-phosphate transferase [Deltaproteobacteria bacterium]|nr:undecaprenyl/decaprenyl-phosphate alpha-N-acetylglucosaminyl 1-phosphate transferase [Deltaproteobacteria bacterium]
MIYLFSILISFYITVVLIPPLSRLARRVNLVDIPDSRKIHKGLIPRIGGVGIVIGAVVPIWIWVPMADEFRAFLSGVVILLIFGFLDDLIGLSYKKKLLGQVLAAGVTMAMGHVFIINLGVWTSGEIILPYYLALPLTFFFILGITNAINLADGLDGLAGGLCVFIFLSLALLAYLDGSSSIMVCCLGIVGALLAFLRYNSFPAAVFMGDTGSQFLGFSAAVLCIYLTQSQSTAIARTLPLIILGLPIMDTLTVMGERIMQGGSPFKADTKHFHYQLLRIGLSQKDAVVMIYLVQALMCLLSIQFRYYTELWIILTYSSFTIAVLISFYLIHRVGWRFNKGLITEKWWNKYIRKKVIYSLESFSLNYIKITLPLGLIWLAVSSPLRVAEWNILILIMLLVTIATFYINKLVFKVFFRVTSYVLVMFLLLNSQETNLFGLPFSQQFFHYIFWGSLAACALVYLIVTRLRFLETTPLDYLILLLVVSIPFLPMEQVKLWHLGTVAGGMVVFLWSSEILLDSQKKDLNMFSISCLIAVVILALRQGSSLL